MSASLSVELRESWEAGLATGNLSTIERMCYSSPSFVLHSPLDWAAAPLCSILEDGLVSSQLAPMSCEHREGTLLAHVTCTLVDYI